MHGMTSTLKRKDTGQDRRDQYPYRSLAQIVVD